MLKTTRLFDMPTFEKNNSKDKIIRFGINKSADKLFN